MNNLKPKFLSVINKSVQYQHKTFKKVLNVASSVGPDCSPASPNCSTGILTHLNGQLVLQDVYDVVFQCLAVRNRITSVETILQPPPEEEITGGTVRAACWPMDVQFLPKCSGPKH